MACAPPGAPVWPRMSGCSGVPWQSALRRNCSRTSPCTNVAFPVCFKRFRRRVMDFCDLAVAARVLRKSPVFALTATLTIALGVGASTAIFSVTNAVLLRPLPYHHPDRLVVACTDMRKRNVRDFPFSNADFIDLREGTKAVFEDIAGVFTSPLTLQREDGTAEQADASIVTINTFRLLGGGIAYGRDFNDDDVVPNPAAPPPGAQQGPPPPRLPLYAILSYESLKRRYGGDPSVLGGSIQIAGAEPPSLIIVG